MWRLYVWANHLRWWGMLEVGLAMLDGSYWQDSIYDCRDFGPVAEPHVDYGGGD